jgi:hypothetical protein
MPESEAGWHEKLALFAALEQPSAAGSVHRGQ